MGRYHNFEANFYRLNGRPILLINIINSIYLVTKYKTYIIQDHLKGQYGVIAQHNLHKKASKADIKTEQTSQAVKQSFD